MTEKQGGSDLRQTQKRRRAGRRRLAHRRAQMVLLGAALGRLHHAGAHRARRLLLPRAGLAAGRQPQPDQIQRLKDKCGNRSNASSEVEFRGA